MSATPSGLGLNPITGTPLFTGRQTVQDEALAFDPYGSTSINFGGDRSRFTLRPLQPFESFGTLPGPGATGRAAIFALPENLRPFWTNPQAFQSFKDTLGADVLPAFLANQSNAAAAFAATQAGQGAGLATGQGAFDRVEQSLADFQDNPLRAAIREALMARSAPDARVFSQAQEATLLNTIAQTASTAASRRLFSSGGQGGPGTASSAAQATADAIAASQGVAAVANVDAVNQAARDRAIGDLAGFQAEEDRAIFNHNQALTEIDAWMASIQAGNEFVPGDPAVFAQWDWVIQEGEDLNRRLDEADARAEEALQFGPVDAATGALQMFPGLPWWLLNKFIG